ncbi:predicted ORF [Xanthomonas phage XacN1]|nr:predicted ORF [Xanthomonas phage XacN1]
MKFKLYQNKSSVKKKNSRYLQGGETDVFKERLGWWEKRTDIPNEEISDTVFVLTKRYEHRPYLVAKIFLDREDLEWLILQYNEIVDIMEEFVAGREIRIPSKNRVNFSIITKPTTSNKL